MAARSRLMGRSTSGHQGARSVACARSRTSWTSRETRDVRNARAKDTAASRISSAAIANDAVTASTIEWPSRRPWLHPARKATWVPTSGKYARKTTAGIQTAAPPLTPGAREWPRVVGLVDIPIARPTKAWPSTGITLDLSWGLGRPALRTALQYDAACYPKFPEAA